MRKFLSIVLVVLAFISIEFITSYGYSENEAEEIIVDDLDLPDGEYIAPFNSAFVDPVLQNSIDDDGVFIGDPLENKSNDNGLSTFNAGNTSEITDLNCELNGLTLEQLLSESDGIGFKNIINIPGESSGNRSYIYDKIQEKFVFEGTPYINMQGSCSDGKYVYYAFYVADNISSVRQPVGVCILSGYYDDDNSFVTKKITYSSDLLADNCLENSYDLQHANDIAYNGIRDKLIILCCQPGYHNVAYSLDAAYFRGETDVIPNAYKHELSCRISNITYNEKYNKYIGGVTSDTDYFVFFDADFNIVGGFNSETNLHSNVGRQAICCDDNYIYSTYNILNIYDTDITVGNVICIYDWAGNLIKELNLDIDRVVYQNSRGFYEMEGITILDEKILIGFNCFFRKQPGGRVAYFYQYDLSSEFFTIKYCPDDQIENHIYDTSLKTQNVLYGLSTKTLENTYRKNGYKFLGWNIYSVNTNMWRYYNPSTNTWKWCREGYQPSGYEKGIYAEIGRVSQTVSAGNEVLFCAVWEETDNFYVSFDSNLCGVDGSGVMEDIEIVHGTPTALPNNTFTKSGRTFKGWNAYAVEIGKWYYQNVSTGERGWYKEGEQPDGYIKYTYQNRSSIKQTVSKGSHVIFFAQWNEFIIYYDAGGRIINKSSILYPTVAIYGNTNILKKYSLSSIHTDDSVVNSSVYGFEGYNQHRLERDLWRYADENNLNPYWATNSSDPLYVYTGSSVAQTGAIGEHIVFKAKWN